MIWPPPSEFGNNLYHIECFLYCTYIDVSTSFLLFCFHFVKSSANYISHCLFTFLYLSHWFKLVPTSSSSSISRDFFHIRKYSNPISLVSSSRSDFLRVCIFFPHHSHVVTVMLDGHLLAVFVFVSFHERKHHKNYDFCIIVCNNKSHLTQTHSYRFINGYQWDIKYTRSIHFALSLSLSLSLAVAVSISHYLIMTEICRQWQTNENSHHYRALIFVGILHNLCVRCFISFHIIFFFVALAVVILMVVAIIFCLWCVCVRP